MNFREATEILQGNDQLPFEEVKSIIDNIQDKIIAPIIDLDNSYFIMRGVDYFNDPNEIQNADNLSYPPAHKVTTFGRVNLPGIPVFYGIIPTQETPINIGACLTECSARLRSPMPEGIYQACISRWSVKNGETLSLFSIINPERGRQRTPFLEGLNLDYEVFVAENEGEISRDDNFLLHNFLYEQFNKEGTERDYWISALISDNLMKAGLDGILYESVQGRNIGFDNTICIALSKDAVDNKLGFIDYTFVRSNYYFANGEGLQLSIGRGATFNE